MIKLPWQPLDHLLRAPGDEEKQDDNLIVPISKMHI